MNIEKQIDSNKKINLFYHDLDKVMNLDKSFIRGLLELKQQQAALPVYRAAEQTGGGSRRFFTLLK